MLGYALIYWPWMPGGFNVEEKARGSTWIESLYFSGITLTTLGYGDLTPRGTVLRLIALGEASTGFVFISLAVTYLLNVTNALDRKRIVALSIYDGSLRATDAAAFLKLHFRRGRFLGLETLFVETARGLQAMLESHIENPIIHYFHPVEVHQSLARTFFLVLESCTVVRSCLDQEVYADLCDHPSVLILQQTTCQVLHRLTELFDLGAVENAPGPGEGLAASRADEAPGFEQSLLALAAASMRPCADTVAGRTKYLEIRRGWEGSLRGFAHATGFEWKEVTAGRECAPVDQEKGETADGERRRHL